MTARAEKVAAFRALHVPGHPFIMPNPWDAGSARVMAGLGAKALATTSTGHAFTLGRPDMGHVGRDEALEHAAEICAATPLPVNGDLENMYGEAPETVAETVRLAAEAGLAGASVEDTALPDTGAYAFELAVERVRAAVDAARQHDIVLTARADGWLNRAYDGAEVLRRCSAFAEAGAEVIYAPLAKPDVQAELCKLGPAVNILGVGPYAKMSREEIGGLGAARISIGGALARVTHAALIDATSKMLENGDLSGLLAGVGADVVDPLLEAGKPS